MGIRKERRVLDCAGSMATNWWLEVEDGGLWEASGVAAPRFYSNAGDIEAANVAFKRDSCIGEKQNIREIHSVEARY